MDKMSIEQIATADHDCPGIHGGPEVAKENRPHFAEFTRKAVPEADSAFWSPAQPATAAVAAEGVGREVKCVCENEFHSLGCLDGLTGPTAQPEQAAEVALPEPRQWSMDAEGEPYEDPTGTWITFEDYAALREQNAQLRAARDAAKHLNHLDGVSIAMLLGDRADARAELERLKGEMAKQLRIIDANLSVAELTRDGFVCPRCKKVLCEEACGYGKVLNALDSLDRLAAPTPETEKPGGAA